MSIQTAIPLEEILTRFHQAPDRRIGGERGRDWWLCPFHDDRNPSLSIIPETDRWKCFGCGTSGDAIEFVRRLNPSMSFQEAKVAIGAIDLSSAYASPAHARVRTRARNRPGPERPEGWGEVVREIVEGAVESLWSPRGSQALRYLMDSRGLRESTIREARLGWWPADEYRDGVYPDKPIWIPQGITIPWIDREGIQAVQVRRLVRPSPDGSRKAKKYVMIRGSHRVIYPSRSVILPGRPLILAEGEFDVLLLNQELAGLVPAITLGSAGDRPDSRTLLAMAKAAPWYIAGDDDGAGERSAEDWIARSGRCRRVTPPAGDWTDAQQAGVALADWWAEFLEGGPAQIPTGRPDNSDNSDKGDLSAPGPQIGGNLLRAPDPLPGPIGPGIIWVNPDCYLEGEAPPERTPDPWRWTVANWPHERWVRWRRRSDELQPSGATSGEIAAADHEAYLQIQAEPASSLPARPPIPEEVRGRLEAPAWGQALQEMHR